ncbi:MULTISPECIES: hypothetical protein [Rhizobium]|nr:MULTISPECIES: hypothetical protein [Rhizobium]
MSAPLTQFTINEAAPGYWRVTFNNPPLSFCDPETLIEGAEQEQSEIVR